MAIEITVPDIGDFTDVEIIELLVKPGDKLELETPLLTLETDKATIDVPSPAAGVLKSLAVNKGDRVSRGSVIGMLEPAGSSVPKAGPAATADAADEASVAAQPAPARAAVADEPEPEADAAPRRKGPSTAPPAALATPAPVSATGLPPIDEAGFSKAYAGPSVRKLARELGADLARVQGTGEKGRITHDDVKAFVKNALRGGSSAATGAALPKIPEVDFAKFGAVKTQPLSRIQKISGARLQASWLNIPHVWQMDEADITDMDDARKRLKDKAASAGVKLTPLAFVLRACVKALQEFPTFNSSLAIDGEHLVLKQYIHLGFAADTPNGLVVPVIRDADKKDIYELARELATLSEKARAGKLSAAEMQGASFTVSSLGGIGGTAFTPIINAPEVAILGVARSSLKPIYQADGSLAPRLILPFTLAYDHRVIDGAAAVRFTTFLAGVLADAQGLIEAVP